MVETVGDSVHLQDERASWGLNHLGPRNPHLCLWGCLAHWAKPETQGQPQRSWGEINVVHSSPLILPLYSEDVSY